MVLKRKTSVHGVCIDPKKKVAAAQKAPTKAELIEEVKCLKKLNSSLEDENQRKTYIIEKLEKKLASRETQSIETQTFQNETKIQCNVCIYVATCEDELKWHMGEEHDVPTDMFFDSDFPCDICGKCCRSGSDLINHLKKHEETFNPSYQKSEHGKFEPCCNFCENIFDTTNALMIHKKKYHSEKVKECWNLVQGECVFGDERCWFIHSDKNSATFEIQEFKCKTCGKVENDVNNFLLHKRNEHEETVQQCRNGESCTYKQNCWFLHKKQLNKETDQNNLEVVERIFNMMENFTERIVKLEKIMKKN